MMERENSNRTRKVTLRLRPEEYLKLEQKFQATTCRKLSDFIRRQLFDKPIVSTYKNESVDNFMEETILLRNELTAIGKNINQIAKKLNSVSEMSDFKQAIFLFNSEKEILFSTLFNIRNQNKKIAERWLQS
ncbi:MAG: plasmid mobilization relaxosome protein MobC [Flavobacterium sp.]